jgi:hypothetical protein
MLITPSTSRLCNRHRLAQASRRAEIPVSLRVIGAELRLATMPWSAYWQPCGEYVKYDRRLVHRLVQLRKSWRSVLHNPSSALHQGVYCWRYFLLC